MGIKCSKAVEWLLPYIQCADGLVNLDKLKSITTFKVPVSKIKQTEACLTRYDAKNFRMTITLYEQVRVRHGNRYKVENVRHRLSYVLDSLAHELAHLKQFDHKPAHLALQAKIMIRMAKVAEQQGITDLTLQWKKPKCLKS